MPTIDTGDTAWLLVSTALVMLMTPGLALFYGGMVQRKNVLSTFMHSFFALGLVTVQWAVVGYSLAFAPTHGGLVGGLDFAFLRGVGLEPKGTVPHLLFAMYQGMFAVITPALISGAFAERMKFSAYCLFTLLWATLVYDPVAHWVWGPDGWLMKRGALDFAGGTVVHLTSGVSALVAAVVVGKRLGYPTTRHQPHNVTMTVLGAGILWFGWFGFNAGSALTSGGLAALALANTHLAAAAGALAWGFVEMARIRKVTMLGAASGLVAGLVAITPAAGFVGPMAALAIGAAAGLACYAGVLIKSRFGYDDALDAFGVHGVGGALGAVLTGVFAAKAFNPAGADGLLAGHAALMGTQLLGVAAAAAYAGVASLVILKILDATLGLRVAKDDEREGLDVALHAEQGYAFGLTGGALSMRRDEQTVPAPAARLPHGAPVPALTPESAD
ncbi:MAG TPA: ammonium transporter [Myxococcota bacterium]|jgi:Amt family ammonium transporter|nr:ammonium transporter [Myxococcota bacterium]